MHIEEIRSGRKQLALQSMRKYPGTRDAESLLTGSEPNVRNVTGDGVIIVHFGATGKLEKSTTSLDFGTRETAIYRLGDL
jgi:hypothetical protein